MNPFAIVVAVDQNNGIGKAGQLPWHLPEDLRRFKRITTQTASSSARNAVIMGRKTWESIPAQFRPLPDRINVVLTRQTLYPVSPEVLKSDSLDHALAFLNSPAMSSQVDSVFVIGGSEVFREAIGHDGCHRIHLTRICSTFACDTFFPCVPANFRVVSTGPRLTHGPIKFYFEVLEKNI